MKGLVRTVVAAAALAFLCFPADAQKIVGWRGDGTGRYPDATPPTTWSKDANGQTKGILWQVKMPTYSFSMPIIVGDKLITRTEPYDLVCMDKNSGKVLWVRTHAANEAATANDKKNPLWKEVEAAAAKLREINDKVYAVGRAQPEGAPKEMLEEKKAIENQLNDLMAKIDAKYKLPADAWRGKWAGYTGSTPTSDGKDVYFYSSMGVVGCWGLDGKKKWAHYEQFPDTEHSNGAAPALAGDRLIFYSYNMKMQKQIVALNKETGAELWRIEPKVHNYGAGVVAFQVGNKWFCIAGGYFMDCADGKQIFIDDNVKPAEMCPTPVIEGNTACFGDSAGRLIWDRFEAGANGGLKVVPVKRVEFRFADRSKYWDNAANYWTGSPLCVNGKVWFVSNQGRLVIVDAEKGVVTVDEKLDMDVNQYKTNVHGGYVVGVCASPTLAGKYVYLWDNCGGTIVMDTGAAPKVVAHNRIVQNVDPWDPRHWDAVHQECTISTPVFEGKRMYYRAEHYMYCIGQ